MNKRSLRQIFKDTDYVHRSGTTEELRAAEYLKARCEALGVQAWLEEFRVPMGQIEEAQVLADGEPIPCEGLSCCGSGSVEGELYYMPGQDPVSIAGARDKIVLMDTLGIGRFTYQDLVKAGAKGILFQYGKLHAEHEDIDRRDLREHVVNGEKKLLCAMLNAKTAVRLVRDRVRRVRITIRQREYDGCSHNVVARIPGRRDE